MADVCQFHHHHVLQAFIMTRTEDAYLCKGLLFMQQSNYRKKNHKYQIPDKKIGNSLPLYSCKFYPYFIYRRQPLWYMVLVNYSTRLHTRTAKRSRQSMLRYLSVLNNEFE